MGNNISTDSFIEQCNYVFPPLDMIYEENGLPIIRRISTLLYLDCQVWKTFCEIFPLSI